MAVGTSPTVALDTSAPGVLSRRVRLAANLRDLLALLPLLVIASTLAVAWLLVRTAWGREDVRDIDGAIALALLGAVVPTWLARLAVSMATTGATPGQRALRVHLEATRDVSTRWALAIRLATHPFGAIGWAWIAGVLALAGLFQIAATFALVAVLVAIAGLGSLAIILVRPGALTLHDRASGLRPVRA